jgi:cell division protein FtsI (penicillin-binding protein 3)
MAGGVFKSIAEKIFAGTVSYNLDKMPADSAAVKIPQAKGGDLHAVENVMKHFGIRLGTDSVESPWVMTGIKETGISLKNVSEKKGVVPHVVGMGAKDAVFLLENQGLRVSISGMGKVTSQSIPPGSRAIKGQTIAIVLN